MNMMEAPTPPPVMISLDFKSDKIMGVIIMVVAGLSALFGLLEISAASMLAPMDEAMNKAAMVPPAKGSHMSFKTDTSSLSLHPTRHPFLVSSAGSHSAWPSFSSPAASEYSEAAEGG